MGYYRVLLRCELPDGFCIDEEPMSGFYTTRFVDAGSDVAAGDAAIEALQREAKFVAMRANLPGNPLIKAEEIEPEQTRRVDAPLHGYVFFAGD